MSQPYFDTGLVLKLIIEEPLSAVIQNWLEIRGVPVPYTRLVELEVENTLQAKYFRGEINARQLKNCQKLISELLAQGMFFRPVLVIDEVMMDSLEVMSRVTAITGCRTLDLLHVVSARKLGYREFLTTDKRQAEAARLLDLSLVPLS
jgi:predicted nucleic acid-binding protein